MKVILSPRAEKELKKIHKIDQIAVVKKLRLLQKVSTSEVKKGKLVGYPDIFRIRVGQYRIVYHHEEDEMYIILIGDRKDIYQLLERLSG